MTPAHGHEFAERGYRLVYRPDVVNACPGCGHSNWLLGRHSAECAFCTTALPLQNAQDNRENMA